MAFDIGFYHDMSRNLGKRIAMHCDSVEKADAFCELLHNMGKVWGSGISYQGVSNFERYKENTLYYFLEGCYGSLLYCNHDNVIVLEYDDFNLPFAVNDNWEDKINEICLLY